MIAGRMNKAENYWLGLKKIYVCLNQRLIPISKFQRTLCSIPCSVCSLVSMTMDAINAIQLSKPTSNQVA